MRLDAVPGLVRSRFPPGFLAFLLLPAALGAQEKRNLTLDDLYDPAKRVDFNGTAPSGLVWLSDTHYLWPKTDTKTRSTDLLKVEAASGKTVPFFDAAKMEAALIKIPGGGPRRSQAPGPPALVRLEPEAQLRRPHRRQ